jgi:hypothetical protein
MVAAVALGVWRLSSPSPLEERMLALLGKSRPAWPTVAASEQYIEDPVFPGARARLLGERDASFDGVRAKPGPNPLALQPRAADRDEKSVAQRGGVDPCNRPDDGFGLYERWHWGGGAGKLLVPVGADSPASGAVFHFAGYELARKEFQRAQLPLLFLGVSFGNGGLDYRRNLSGPGGLSSLRDAVSASLEKLGESPEIPHVALGAWSAGYSGVGVLLQQSENTDDVDAVILLDGLHASRDDEVAIEQLGPFIRFAERAARGEAFMFVSYSSVGTDGYASSHETARRVVRELGGVPLAVERQDAGGLELKEMFSQGGFHARGYKGGGEGDHCAHLLLYPELARALVRRWGR